MSQNIVDTDLREVPFTVNKTVTITDTPEADVVVDPPSDAVYIATDDSIVAVFERDADGTERTLAIPGYHPIRIRAYTTDTTSVGSFICYREKSGDNGT